MASQGIQLPISLQLSNLQDIVKQLKQFASSNVLADSFGGKKLDKELNQISDKLERISAKSKTAFTTQSDFASIQREIDAVEVSLNKAQGTIQNLSFGDLKIPADVMGNIDALQERIRALNSSLISFKGTQKEKLVNNQDFLANLNVAAPEKAADMLSKGYDELYTAIQTGMSKVNQRLALATAEYNKQQELLTQNKGSEKFVTQWGAIDYMSAAFKTVGKNGQQNDIQKSLQGMLNFDQNGVFSGFTNGGAPGIKKFLGTIKDSFSFSDTDIADIRARLKEQAEKLKVTQTEVFKQLGNNPELAKNILFGDKAGFVEAQKDLINQITSARDAAQAAMQKWSTRRDAFANINQAFDLPQKEIKAKAQEIAEALKIPQEALKGWEAAVVSAVAKSPQLAALFGDASAQVGRMTQIVEQGKQRLQQIDTTIGKMQGISNFINRYVGIYAIMRKVTTMIRNAFNNIKELDAVITKIAVVTNMSQEDLWGKIGEYTSMAQQYGVATKDVYTVSQIFYQQGLQTAQVMSLTTETLKMAKIAGLDYAAAANAMTVAIRAFNIDMAEAQQVTDTYSALAAKFAVDSGEIANAMEKTASSAANVGMSLQSTSAFMSVMIQTTRESAQNIGSALKSIISRYGEMKASPKELLNVDGEEVSFNKVDTALKSVGISIKDASGQFRDFDDVILELAKKWNTLDNNTQRYIATIMAGNRQQSRFIALVSNSDELIRAMDVANNSQNTSIVQTAKTMDSLETKANQLKNAFSQIYLDLHIENGLKDIYDWLTRILKTIGKLGMLKGALPTLANIIGVGSGARWSIDTYKKHLESDREGIRAKLELDTKAAEQEKDKFEAQLKEEVKKVLDLDTTKAEQKADALKTKIDQIAETAQTITSPNTIPDSPTNNFNNLVYGAYKANTLGSETGRAELLSQLGVASGTDQFDQMNSILANMQGLTGTELTTALTALEQAFNGTTSTVETLSTEVQNASTNVANAGLATNEVTNTATIATTMVQTGGQQINQGLVDASTAAVQAGQSLNDNSVAANQSKQSLESLGTAASDDEKSLSQLTPAVQASTAELQRLPAEVATNTTAIQQNNAALSTMELAAQSAAVAAFYLNMVLQSSANQITMAILKGMGSLDKLEESSNNTGLTLIDNSELLKRITATVANQLAQMKDAAKEATDGLSNIPGSNNGPRPGLPGPTNENPKPAQNPKLKEGPDNPPPTKKDSGLSWSNWGTGKARTIAGIGTTAARMLGMTIMASGAAREDKADDKVESSKLLTGLGNGLSSAGTGASMLMGLGPWGAAVGAIGGFLLGGLGAILDGAEYKLSERIENAQREAQKKSDESLKAQAKVTDMSSQIENLKSLQKVMYNSTEDMQAYKEAMINMASAYPELITGYDSAGNAIIDLTNAEQVLAQARIDGAQAARAAAVASSDVAKKQLEAFNQFDPNTQEGADVIFNGVQQATTSGALRHYMSLLQSGQNPYGVLSDLEMSHEPNPYSILTNPAILNRIQSEKRNGLTDKRQLSNDLIKDFGITDWFTEYQKTLNLSDLDTVARRDKGSTAAWTIEQLTRVLDYMDAVQQQVIQRKESLDELVDSTVGYEDYVTRLKTDKRIDDKERNQLSDSKNFQRVYTSMLTSQMDTKTYASLDEWQTADAAGFAGIATDTYNNFVTWYEEELSPALRKEFVDLDYTSFKSATDITSHFGINKDDNQQLYDSIVNNFIEQNQSNRDRILRMVWGVNEDGNVNTDAEKLNLDEFKGIQGLGDIGKKAFTQIGKAFDGRGADIISKYADFFATNISDINELANNGYTQLASTRLTLLNYLSNTLAQLDSSQQEDLFGIITNIDFSNFDSLRTARESLETYAEKNNIDLNDKTNNVAKIYRSLTRAENNLVFNVTTLSETLTTDITSTAKNIDSILTANKSGFSLDKALDAMKSINAKLGKAFTFDELFTYDAALGKYVYTTDGLKARLESEEKHLREDAEQLDKAAKLSNTASGLPELIVDGDSGEFLSIEPRHRGSYTKELKDKLLQDTGVSDKTNTQLTTYYDMMAENFLATEDSQHTWDDWITYLQEQATKNNDEANAAKQILEAYKGNKKNQLFGAIDWNKLITNTDFSGTNQVLMEALADSLYKDDDGNIKDAFKERYKDGKLTADWQQVYNDYLDATYGSMDEIDAIVDEDLRTQKKNARKAAEATLMGQRKKSLSSQVSTAITEVLAGAGSVLSETTTALMLGDEGLKDRVPESGILDAGNSVLNAADYYLDTAIQLYEAHKTSLLSVAERNKAYSEILTQRYVNNNSIISSISSGASLDISGLTTLFDTLQFELSDYFNAATGTWMNGFEDVLSTDQFGKTRITNWGKFISKLSGNGVDMTALSGTFEFKNAYSSYVDGLVTLDNQTQELIKKSYDNAFSDITGFKSFNVSQLSDSVTTYLAGGINGDNGAATIENGVLKINNAVQYAKNASDLFAYMSTLPESELYNLTGLTKSDLAKNWKNVTEVITQVGDTWIGLSENITGLTTDNISTLIEKGDFRLPELNNFTKIGDSYVMILDQYEEILRNKLADDPNAEAKINEAVHKAEQAVVNKISGLDWTKMLNGTATSAETDTFMTALDASLTSLRIDVQDYYTDGQLDVSGIITALKDLHSDVADQIVENLTNMIQGARDTVLSAIGTAGQYAMEGTTSLADMQKFIDEYNRIKPEDADAIDMSSFSYDTNLQKFTLDGSVLQRYVEAQREQLKQLGLNDAAIDAYIRDQTSRMLQSNMDITSILDGMSTPEQQTSMQNLASVINDYLAQGNKVYGKISKERRTAIEEQIASLEKLEMNASSAEEASKYQRAIEELQQQLNVMTTKEIIATIYNGGEEAVKVLKQLKGKEVTSEEIAAVYNAGINRLNAAEEALASGAGTVLTGIAAEIARVSDGIEVVNLPDGSAVITSVTSMVDVYANIYKRMQTTAGATTSSLNAAYAKLLTAADQKNIDALETLQNASSMTYEAFGELLASYDIKLEDVLNGIGKDGKPANWGVEQDFLGNIRITDFDAFAKQMKWDINSPEYAEAYSQWADSMAELQNRPISMMESAAEELKGLTEAKAGSVVNVSYLEKLLPESFGNIVKSYGLELNNGLLKITETTNLPQLITAIANEAARTSNMLPEQLAEVADAVAGMLDNIVNLIKNGITGSLSNTDANTLQQWADQFNIDLDFTKTAEGLKLSQDSAIKLYNALEKTDSIKSKLVFDELNDSLRETNEHYQSVSDIAARIAWIEDEEHHERRDQYAEELELAKQILAVRSTTEDDSFNFMSGKIPGAQNNPINYFNNWAQALHTLQEAKKSYSKDSEGNIHKGLIDYQDWYNIVNEMNNLAALGDDIEVAGVKLDGSMEAAAALIEKGASALTVDSAGNVKVALGDIGVDFKAGTDTMSKGIDKGIDQMADSQIAMLDALIALLEAIVSMEKLGDLDLDGNGIDLSELFAVTYDQDGWKKTDWTKFNEDYEKWRQDMIKQLNLEEGQKGFNEDLQNALKGIKIGGISLAEIIKWEPKDLRNADKSVQQAYTAILTAFSNAAKSGNYDLDNIQQSVLQTLKESGLEGTVQLDIGDITWSISGNSIMSIDWSTTEAKTVIDKLKGKYGNDIDKTKEAIRTSLQKVQEGKGTVEDVETVLQLDGKLTLNSDGGGGKVTINGQEYTFTESNKVGYLNAAMAEKLGFKLPKDWKTKANNGGTFTFETKIGDVDVEVDIVNGQPQYKRPGSTKTYPSEQALIDGEYEYYLSSRGMDSDEDVLSKEEWVYRTFGIRAAITPTITYTKGGEKVDLNNDPNARKTLKEITEQTDEFFKEGGENLKATGDGNYKLTYKGLTLDLDGDSITTDGNVDPEKVKAQIMQALGLDTGLAETIGVAVTDALTSAITSLNTIDDENLSAVATALSSILTSLTGLQTIDYETIAKGLASLTPSSGEGGEGGSSGGGEGGETPPVPVDKITVLPSAIEIDASGATIGMPVGTVLAITDPVVATGLTNSLTLDLLEGVTPELHKTTDADTTNIGDIGATSGLTDKLTVKADETTIKELDSGIQGVEVESIGDVKGKASSLEVDIGGIDAGNITTTTGNNSEGGTAEVPFELGDIGNARGYISSLAIIAADDVTVAADLGADIAGQITSAVQIELDNNPVTIKVNPPGGGGGGSGEGDGEGGGTGTPTVPFLPKFTPFSTGGASTLDTSPIAAIQAALDTITTDKVTAIKTAQDEIKTTQIDKVKTAINAISSAGAENAKSAINGISSSNAFAVQRILNNLQVSIEEKTAKANLNVYVTAYASAKGNVALAGGTPTLMGELGPELVVSNGRYFVVGQSGAEFVDLDKDAIVFNHRQTERLLANGGINSRGKPFTNETNAISRAKGNVEGDAFARGPQVTAWRAKWARTGTRWSDDLDMGEIKVGTSDAAAVKGTGKAMASASAALAALKQLRAQWEALKGLSVKDLAGKGAGGGGGGGNNKAFIKDLEKWYNWLQEIATLEEKINYQEKLRQRISSDNMKNGRAYFTSQMETLENLEKQLAVTEDLAKSQQKYFNERRAALNSDKNPFSSLYQFDENGQIKYKPGKLKQLSKIFETDQYNKPKMTPEQQYDYVVNTLKIDKKYLQYDSSGNKLEKDDYAGMMQAFWDKIDADKEEMQSLHDSVNEQMDKVQELQQKQNELLQDMQDNQMEVENAVLDAMIETREREIDELTDLKDAYSKAAEDMVNGLNEALNKEREAYNKSEEDKDLLSLRRRLQIAQRSGAPASEIANLQEQIRQKSQDAYFNEQEQQINALQEAANTQIEKMEKEIDILTETLEYQKKHGLLWNRVAAIMEQSPEKIAEYIHKNTEEYWGKSPLANSEAVNDWLFKAEQWVEFRDVEQDQAALLDELAHRGERTTLSSDQLKSFKSNFAKEFGGSWWNLSSGLQTKFTDILKEQYQKHGGDYDAAIAATKEEINKSKYYTNAIERAGQWSQKVKDYKSQFGSLWTDEISENIKQAFVTGGTDGEDIALHKEKLWVPVKWSNGKWGVAKASSKNTMAWDYTGAYAQAHWNTLLEYNPNLPKAIKDYKQTYIRAYTNAARTDDPKKPDTWAGRVAGNKALEELSILKDKNIKINTYDIGGMVDTTGLALLHAKEGVLTPEQTDVLRNEILGGQKDSLMNLLLDFRKAYTGIGNVALAAAPNVVIENASVNMNVDSIANDYDARRAGEQALTEMLRIARKTGSANSISRR